MLTAMWICPVPNGGSQCSGALSPSSRSFSARAAIPARNASGKLRSESSGTPSAASPGWVMATEIHGLAGPPPAGRGIDVRRQTAQELAAGPRILHVEHGVRAVVRLRPVAQHRRLDVVELE